MHWGRALLEAFPPSLPLSRPFNNCVTQSNGFWLSQVIVENALNEETGARKLCFVCRSLWIVVRLRSELSEMRFVQRTRKVVAQLRQLLSAKNLETKRASIIIFLGAEGFKLFRKSSLTSISCEILYLKVSRYGESTLTTTIVRTASGQITAFSTSFFALVFGPLSNWAEKNLAGTLSSSGVSCWPESNQKNDFKF